MTPAHVLRLRPVAPVEGQEPLWPEDPPDGTITRTEDTDRSTTDPEGEK